MQFSGTLRELRSECLPFQRPRYGDDGVTRSMASRQNREIYYAVQESASAATLVRLLVDWHTFVRLPYCFFNSAYDANE